MFIAGVVVYCFVSGTLFVLSGVCATLLSFLGCL